MENSESKVANKKNTSSAKQIAGVRFQSAGKFYHFIAPADMNLSLETWVVVETVFGDQVGQVVSVLDPADPESKDNVNVNQLKMVLRVANSLDMAQYQIMQQRAERMLSVVKEEVASLKGDVKVVSVEFSLDGNKALVLCTGSFSKGELSVLRRQLARRMRCRVELRSVGPRDQAKALAGYGVCGEPCCCSRFLTEFQKVSIRMAKEQSISMAPSDITGMCGRLRCCLAYEHQVYKDASAGFPRLKARVQTDDGLGRVIDWDVLKGEIVVEIPPEGPKYERKRFRYKVEEVEVVPRKN